MSNTRAIVWPGSFGDTTLPKVDLSYTPPTPGALYSWIAANQPLGSLTQWADSISGVTPALTGTAPTVIDTPAVRVVDFNGETGGPRMMGPFPTPLAGSYTAIVVYRLTKPITGGEGIIFASSTTTQGGVYVQTGENPILKAADGSSQINTTITADNDWHVAILTIDGSSSALRIDGYELAGTLTGESRNGIQLGTSIGATSRAAIQYARVEFIPGPMNNTKRAALAQQLMRQHGIN